jgi:hypothetical protein
MNRFRVMLTLLVAIVALMAGIFASQETPVHAQAAHPVCAVYRVLSRGQDIPATVTCVAIVKGIARPGSGTGCSGDVQIFSDANYGGDELCFGPGSYNLTGWSFCWLGLFDCFNANDQMSSFINNSGNAGYFSWDINNGGAEYWFSAHQRVSYVGNLWNDQASYLKVY